MSDKEKLIADLETIARILRRAEGIENAITALEIAFEMGINERQVRKLISENADWFWDRDISLLAATGKGFYIGVDIAEMQSYRDYLFDMRGIFAAKIYSLDNLCKRKGITLKKR